MNKEEIYSWLVYIVMLAFAIVIGVTIIIPAMNNGYLPTGFMSFIFIFVWIIIGLIINAIFIELGHVIGAKIGNYEILSVNILSFCIYKEFVNGKLVTKFKAFKNFDGLLGETIISPKRNNSKPILYIFLPLVLFLLEIVGLACCFLYIESGLSVALDHLKYGILIISTIGGMSIIYDYFPTKLDSLNDGYRLVLLNKKVNIEAYNEYLSIVSDKYLKKEHAEYKVFTTLTDFTAKVNLIAAKYYANDNLEKSLEIINNLLNNSDNITKSTIRDIKIYKLELLLYYDKIEDGKDFYQNDFNQEEKKYLISCTTLDSIRSYILYAYLVEGSNSEVNRALDKSEKILKRLLPSEEAEEKEKLDLIKTKINLTINK